MAQLNYPASQAGLAVPVLIGLDSRDTLQLIGAGKPVPPPVLVQGLLDTGSSVTAVAPWVLKRLGVASKGIGSTQTASGQATVNLFYVSFGMLPLGQQHSPSFTLPSILVTELPVALPDGDVLIGLNVLLECKLTLDGLARLLTIEF